MPDVGELRASVTDAEPTGGAAAIDLPRAGFGDAAAARVTALARRLGFVPAPRGTRRPLIDALFVAWLWFGFDAINNLAPVRQQAAESHGRSVLALERALRIAPEHALNVWLASEHTLRDVTVFWYYNVHAIVTFGVLIWVWWRHPLLVPRLRLALVLANLAALAVFWSWPVAPPRMLAGQGYHDLVSLSLGQPVWHFGATALDSNQLTALPSLHIAWAVWAATALWVLYRRRWARALIVVYPFLTLFAVMATANHYLADGLTGVLLIALAFVAADRLLARRESREGLPAAVALASEAPGEF